MRVMLLAGGLGTRLKPITDLVPKCMVKIKGEPLLGIWLDRLTLAGASSFFVNTHYLSTIVEDYINSSQYCKQVLLENELELKGTAGTLVDNLDFFQGKGGMLIHADNYCLADLKAFCHFHQQRPKYCLMTMMTFRTNDPSSCGIVELDEFGVVVGFHEKVANPPGNLANGAIYFLSEELIEILSKEDMKKSKDFSIDILPKLLGRIYSYETLNILLDIGTPENYEIANK